MQLPRYELQTGQNLTTFEFVSEGGKGRITKVIQFEPMEVEGVHNLAFGDRHPITGELDDKAVTDNGDTEKVLATVVAAVDAFAAHHPAAWLYATGSTPARTRLYQMGIHKYFNLMAADFDLLGERNSEWEPYEYGTTYQAVAARRKPPYI